MKLILSFCLCVLAFSKSLEDQNKELARTNQVLLKTLREIAVGEETEVASCYNQCRQRGSSREECTDDCGSSTEALATEFEEKAVSAGTEGVIDDTYICYKRCRRRNRGFVECCNHCSIEGCEDNTETEVASCYNQCRQRGNSRTECTEDCGSNTEKQVGQTNVISTCAPMTGYKACTGPKHKMRNYSRRGKGEAGNLDKEQIDRGILDEEMSGPDWCKLKCQNMGIDGCCEWQDQDDPRHEAYGCYFTAFQSSTISDSGKRKKWGDGFDYEWIPNRYASICSVSNCEEYQMEKVHDRYGGCDYDNIDSEGRMGKGGPHHSQEECDEWCLSKPTCVFAARTWNGYCHGFETCSYEPLVQGTVTKQKVCKGAYEYNNHPGCGTGKDGNGLEDKYCIEPPSQGRYGRRA